MGSLTTAIRHYLHSKNIEMGGGGGGGGEAEGWSSTVLNNPHGFMGKTSCEKYGVHGKQNIRKQTDSFLFMK